MIISLPVHTAVCRIRGSGGPGVLLHVFGTHGDTSATDTRANCPVVGGRLLLNATLRPAHQASKPVFGHAAVAVVTVSGPICKTVVAKNATSPSRRGLTVISGSCPTDPSPSASEVAVRNGAVRGAPWSRLVTSANFSRQSCASRTISP